MARISFRTDSTLDAILEKGTRETGLTESELCRVSLVEYVAKQTADKIQRAHNKLRVQQVRRKAAA